MKLKPVAAFYPPGFFLALVVAHNWPPSYAPSFTELDLERFKRNKRLSEKSRALAEAKQGHAGRDMGLPGSLRSRGVEMMEKPA